MPLVNDRSLNFIPLLLFVAIILGFEPYNEFVFVKSLTLDTDVPCNSTSVMTSSLTSFVTLSITTTESKLRT